MASYIGEVRVQTLCDDTWSFEIKVRDLIDILEAAIREAPPQVADTLKVDLSASTEWECGVASLTITRSETEAEADAREKEQAEQDAKRSADYTARLRADYEKLKAMFGP